MALNPKHQGLQKVVEEADKPWKKNKKIIKKIKNGVEKEELRDSLWRDCQGSRFQLPETRAHNTFNIYERTTAPCSHHP